MSVSLAQLDLVVAEARPVAEGVVLLELTSPRGAELLAWRPGAHLDVVVQPGVERQYSLCGDPADRSRYRIAVLREPDGRGGSAHLHDHVRAGSTLRVKGPLNHFELDAAPAYRFVAGGIGITPILPMIRAAEAASTPWTLDYAGRSRATMAFVDELVEAYGSRVAVHAADEGARLDVVALDPAGAHVYGCGPARMIEALEARAASWPPHTLHVERFEARAVTEPVYHEAFEVELELSGITVTVPPEKSILDVVEEQGVFALWSCREGTCGTCETPVVEGEVDHRDSVLTPEEQDANEVMMICVSRAACPRLVLEL
ncbi:PDR/VanB family oxidoreductase [Cnuibacter sp. UC19_7]|uniref:PDR/VanB family oxidoreductase n=1 Tax=Cnuibacter sp. UC19_7 TaxID=3350166 RepID=UPI00366E2F6B